MPQKSEIGSPLAALVPSNQDEFEVEFPRVSVRQEEMSVSNVIRGLGRSRRLRTDWWHGQLGTDVVSTVT